MRAQSNGGVRAITSPDRAALEKRPPSHHDHPHPHHKSAATSDTKKGGSSSGSGEALAPPPPQALPVWPPKFVIALTNKEKEEDFMAIKGSKLPQRPKKRAKIIQRTINVSKNQSLLYSSFSRFFLFTFFFFFTLLFPFSFFLLNYEPILMRYYYFYYRFCFNYFLYL